MTETQPTPTDIEIIRAILNRCVVFAARDMCEDGALERALRDFSLAEANEALSALDRVEANCLPELPENLSYSYLEIMDSNDKVS